MPDILDVNPLQKFMCLLTGANGTGKSIAIASWLDKGSVYFFDFDGRMNSVANWYKQRGLKRGQLQFDTYGPANIYDAYTKLKEWAEGYCPHAAIAVDSFTAVTVSAVTFSINRRIGKIGTKSGPTTSKGDMIIPDWDEWNAEAMYVTMLLDYCKQIAAKGTAVFWTAHPVGRTRVTAGSGGSVSGVSVQTRYTAFGFKASEILPIYFNEIYALKIDVPFIQGQGTGEPRRLCFTRPAGDIAIEGIAAKTALNLPTSFEWTDDFTPGPNSRNFRSILFDLVEKGGNKDASVVSSVQSNVSGQPNTVMVEGKEYKF